MKKPATGRPSLFRGKDRSKQPLQGRVTERGRKAFDAARKRLAALGSQYRIEGRTWTAKEVSDGDTIEYLAIGHDTVEEIFRMRNVVRNIAKG